MKPGATTRPATSRVVVPRSGDGLTAAIVRPRMPTCRIASSPDARVHHSTARKHEVERPFHLGPFAGKCCKRNGEHEHDGRPKQRLHLLHLLHPLHLLHLLHLKTARNSFSIQVNSGNSDFTW